MVTFVVEGGASRAAYATGVLEALQRAGVVPGAIYGTSAGGALAAWYAAGQAHLGSRTWDRVGDRSLLSFRRLVWRSKPVVDFRKLYADVYPTHFGMDVAALRRAPYPVFATLTDADSAESVYVDLRRAEDPFAVLHATSALPLVSESPVTLGGRRFVDGGVTDPLPVARALHDGHADLLVISNRPQGERRAESRALVRLVGRRFPALAREAALHHEHHNAALRLAEHPPEGARVRIVRPERDLGVTRFTRDARLMRRAIDAGLADGARVAAEL